ncbi:MAG: CPBP family intramembrane glutamic endopeptidase, partial [Myxococcota bacterium]
MRTIGKIVAYLGVVLIGGALLAPPLYWATQSGIEGGWLPRSLAKFDFTKYFNRSTLIVAIAGLYPFLRWVGARRVADLEIEPNPRRFRDLGAGVAIGVVGLWIVAALLLASGQVVFRDPFPAHRFFEALGTAVAVSIIEEVFFRGALFGALRREMSWQRALAFLAPFFAIVHFLKPNPRAGKIADPGWLSGFELIPHAFWQ